MADYVTVLQNKRRELEERESEDKYEINTDSDEDEDTEKEVELSKEMGGFYMAKEQERIDKKFTVLDKIGRGHFSNVWKVKNNNDTVLAMKIQKSARSYRIAAQEEIFIYEIIKKNHGSCENLIEMINSGSFKSDNGRHFYLTFDVMDCDLHAFIKTFEDNKLSMELTSDIAFQLLKGTAFLHNCGFLHSDIKPDNILLKQTETSNLFKLADLGTACAIGDRTNDYLQTSSYRSPEIILSYYNWDEKIDIWSLACVFFECLVGEDLFIGDNESDFIKTFVETLGMPTYAHLKNCKLTRDFFDRNGFIINSFDMRPLPLSRKLVDEHDFSYDDANAISRLLLPMLEWEPAKRWSAQDLLNLYVKKN